MAMTTADIKLTVFMLNAEQAMNLSQCTEKVILFTTCRIPLNQAITCDN